MQHPSLSNVPMELLDKILRCLSDDRQALSRLLRVNKTIGSREVILRFLYQDFRAVPKKSARFPMLLKTLYLSVKEWSCFPYHQHITKLSTDGWLVAIDLFNGNTKGRLHDLLDEVLQAGKLEFLDLSIDNFLGDLYIGLPADFSALKSLGLTFPEDPQPGVNARTWLQTMIPRMPVKELLIYISMHCWEESWTDFWKLSNSLHALEVYGYREAGDPFLERKFWQTFLVPYCHTLTSLTLQDLKMAVNTPVKLPNLQDLTIWSCELEGWETLCSTLTSLKNLELFDVNLVQVDTENILSFFPSCGIKSLESLEIACVSKSNRLPSPWLNAFATSLSSLTVLRVDAISVDTLRNVLIHSPNLTHYSHIPFEDRRTAGPTNKHLQVLSKFTPASLKVLVLHLGNYDSLDLAGFAATFPVSVMSLDLSCSRSLTAPSLRALFQLPLSEFIMRGTCVQPEHQSELELILQTERPVNLKRFIWNFDSSYSFYRDQAWKGTLQYSAWDD